MLRNNLDFPTVIAVCFLLTLLNLDSNGILKEHDYQVTLASWLPNSNYSIRV
jgi:hypothetical protein